MQWEIVIMSLAKYAMWRIRNIQEFEKTSNNPNIDMVKLFQKVIQNYMKMEILDNVN